MTSYNNYNRGYSSRRRASPTYDDYEEPSASSRRSPSPAYESVHDNRHQITRDYPSYNDSNAPYHQQNSYSNYRKPLRPWDDVQPSQNRNTNYDRPSRSSPQPSSSSQQFSSAYQSPYKYRKRTSSPEAPTHVARTEPTPEYLQIAESPSNRIDDASSSRKLLVLDLNGSLLVRSPHRKPANHPTYDPYGDPTRLRAVRTVHPRPYMRAFRDYLFHEKTKAWLDTMVWSSAQPHSVADMVDKSFGERKDELKAVWARDTLGLRADQYNIKTQTTKDLAKPWAEISAVRPGESSSSTPRGSSVPPRSPDQQSPASQSHSAHTTLLMDDSPLKAILQPFNHLCISEYTTDMRKKDLTIVEMQNLKKRREEEEEKTQDMASKDGTPEPTTSFQRDPQNVVTESRDKLSPEEERIERRKEKKRLGKERSQKEREEALLAKLAAVSGEKPISSSSVSSEGSSASWIFGGLGTNSALQYDSTLLAAVGILEHVKHEDNIAAWMKSGGLIQVPGRDEVQVEETKSPMEETDTSVAIDSARKIAVPVADITLEMTPKPDSLNTSKSATGISHTPPSNDSTPVPNKKRRFSDEREPSPLDLAKSADVPAADAARHELPTTTSSTGTEQSAATEGKDVPQKQWFENPLVLTYWAEKGRNALLKLGIPVESGVSS